jgi:hypothetical protein
LRFDLGFTLWGFREWKLEGGSYHEWAVFLSPSLKLPLKRGALVAAANWPVTVIQAVADSLFKLLIAAPLVGGIFLVALVVGAEPGMLLSLEWRDLAATIVASLMSRPVILASFLSALAVVIVGGSLFVFLIKGGTVGVLVRGELEAGPIEHPPLHLHTVMQASRFSIDGFVASARSLFPRYARLGFMLMCVYLASGAAYLVAVSASRSAGEGWGMTALFTAAFVAWITVVNLLYLLMQVVIAADACSVSGAATRVTLFLRRQRRHVTAVFLIVLVIVVFATGASLLATAALGLITFVPFFGLVVLPLQLVAWLLRGLVFQYIGLASVGAYLTLYRSSGDIVPGRLKPAPTSAAFVSAAADVGGGRVPASARGPGGPPEAWRRRLDDQKPHD